MINIKLEPAYPRSARGNWMDDDTWLPQIAYNTQILSDFTEDNHPTCWALVTAVAEYKNMNQRWVYGRHVIHTWLHDMNINPPEKELTEKSEDNSLFEGEPIVGGYLIRNRGNKLIISGSIPFHGSISETFARIEGKMLMHQVNTELSKQRLEHLVVRIDESKINPFWKRIKRYLDESRGRR